MSKTRTNERRAEMERLTERYTATEKPDGESDVWVRDHDYTMAAERLAEYEDTGLAPEEIMKLKERDMPKKIEINAGVPTCPVCGRRIVKCYDFCPDCGQRLKQ